MVFSDVSIFNKILNIQIQRYMNHQITRHGVRIRVRSYIYDADFIQLISGTRNKKYTSVLNFMAERCHARRATISTIIKRYFALSAATQRRKIRYSPGER